MNKQMIHYCFTLSEGQMEFLRSKKYKIDRMDCFMSLVSHAVRETKFEPISKTQQVEILPGQFMTDNTKLSKLWNKDRKTVPKIIESMESLGISSSQKIGDNRILTLHSLSGWYIDGRFCNNRFASKRNDASQTIFHAEVPDAKVITIVDEGGKEADKDGSVSMNANSQGSTKIASSASDGRKSPSPSQSNDSGNMGKSADGNNSSVSVPSSNSHQPVCHDSADNPSSQEEADGKQNEGRND